MLVVGHPEGGIRGRVGGGRCAYKLYGRRVLSGLRGPWTVSAVAESDLAWISNPGMKSWVRGCFFREGPGGRSRRDRSDVPTLAVVNNPHLAPIDPHSIQRSKCREIRDVLGGPTS